MQNKHLRMRLSPEEDTFLRHWMYDETHYEKGTGPAKQLQVQHQVAPVDLAIIIAAAVPDPSEQETAGNGPPPSEPPVWPWPGDKLPARIKEAEGILAGRHGAAAPVN
jgi:hypothetical protein